MPTGLRWLATTASLDDGRVQRLTITVNSKALSYRDVCNLWQQDAEFGIFFSRALAATSFAAFFWEVCPITTTSVDAPFECVIVDSPALSGVTADSSPFGLQLAASCGDDDIATFVNLGGDALLVAPCVGPDASACAHLAAFVRHASAQLQCALWRRVGAALASRIGSVPVWLSTSGLGVYWLHVRLDRQPKYYTYAPYRQADTSR